MISFRLWIQKGIILAFNIGINVFENFDR